VDASRESWSAQQLTKFLGFVSSFATVDEALAGALHRALGILEADFAAVVRSGSLEVSVGASAEELGALDLAAVAENRRDVLDLPNVGRCVAVSIPLDDEPPGAVVIARQGPRTFDAAELDLLHAMTQALALTLKMLRGVANERTLRERSERERAEREATESKYRRLVERLPAIVYMAELGETGAWRYVSPQIESILGFSPEEWMADPELWEKRIHPQDRERVIAEERTVVATKVTTPPTDYRMIARDGRVVWVLDDALLVNDPDGGVYWHGVLYDITDRKRVEMELELRAAQQAAVARIGEHALEGVELADLMNRAVSAAAEYLKVDFASILELHQEQDAFVMRAGVGWPEDSVGTLTMPAGEESHAGFTLERGSAVTVQDWAAEQRFEKPPLPDRTEPRSGMAVIIEGPERPFGVLELQSSTFRAFSSDDVNFAQSLANILADAIERAAAEEEIRRQAVHDPLTRLPNRVLFLDRLAHALAQSRRRRTTVAVLFLDLDHFKLINDSLGHTAGDELLTAVAPRLKETLRPGDTVARFGGDEFGILVEDLNNESDAVVVAEHIGAVFARPFVLNGVEHFVTASIGIAVARDGTERPQSLIRDADAAMYRAKENGRGRYELFDQVMRARAVQRLQLENELRRALGRDELRLHYQPVVSLRTGDIVSCEALVRWQHPGRGLLLPDQFVHVAEDSGMIEALGRWVLEEACRQTVEWQNAHPDAAPIGVSVNLAARQIGQRDLPDVVEEVIASTGIQATSLSLEITESALVEESEGPVETLKALRAMGVRLAIDDFGTGYSSLAYLKRFPLDVLKVDRSFVEGLGTHQETTAIVTAIVAMAGALGIDVIAEGVETALQLSELQRLGCPSAQGFYFTRGLPAGEMSGLIARRRPWPELLDSYTAVSSGTKQSF
jgi:diguanylate cyclase (GGDEF)-like protein/PAS domain S-box-containing protein